MSPLPVSTGHFTHPRPCPIYWDATLAFCFARPNETRPISAITTTTSCRTFAAFQNFLISLIHFPFPNCLKCVKKFKTLHQSSESNLTKLGWTVVAFLEIFLSWFKRCIKYLCTIDSLPSHTRVPPPPPESDIWPRLWVCTLAVVCMRQHFLILICKWTPPVAFFKVRKKNWYSNKIKSLTEAFSSIIHLCRPDCSVHDKW